MNLYKLAQAASFLYLKTFHRFHVSGLENVPEHGAFILASNHVSFFDPPALGCRLPRELHYFAKASLFKGFLGKLIMCLNSIPVDREGFDMKSFKAAMQILEKGEPLLVFPEGTRSEDGQLQNPKRGIGLMARKAQVPILPARISGGFEAFGKGRRIPKLGSQIKVSFGEILIFSDSVNINSSKDEDERIAKKIMQEIISIKVEQK